MWQCVAVCGTVAVWCSVLQCVAVCCIKESGMVVLLHFSADRVYVRFSAVCCSVLQCGVVFRSVLQRLQCVACFATEKSEMVLCWDWHNSAGRMYVQFPAVRCKCVAVCCSGLHVEVWNGCF